MALVQQAQDRPGYTSAFLSMLGNNSDTDIFRQSPDEFPASQNSYPPMNFTADGTPTSGRFIDEESSSSREGGEDENEPPFSPYSAETLEQQQNRSVMMMMTMMPEADKVLLTDILAASIEQEILLQHREQKTEQSLDGAKYVTEYNNNHIIVGLVPETDDNISSSSGAATTTTRDKKLSRTKTSPKALKLTSSSGSGSASGRDEEAHPESVSSGLAHMGGVIGARRNERERNRVRQVNLGFDRLRQHVPQGRRNKKLSKVCSRATKVNLYK